MLARVADRLPHALVLVFDQVEELFTLAKTPEEVAWRDQALRMLQRVADVRADVKVIISLRTEYYGRLLDHLREGRHDLTGVRDDLLRDFSRVGPDRGDRAADAETPWPPGSRAQGEVRLPVRGRRSPRRSPTACWRCARRTRTASCRWCRSSARALRAKGGRPGGDGSSTREDLDAIKGVEGGLKAFAEDALERTLQPRPADARHSRACSAGSTTASPTGR